MLSSVLLLKRSPNVKLRTSVVYLLRYNQYAFHTMQYMEMHALARANKDCEYVLVIYVSSSEIWHSLVK